MSLEDVVAEAFMYAAQLVQRSWLDVLPRGSRTALKMIRSLLASLISISAVSAAASESGPAPRTSPPPAAAHVESATLAGMEPGDRACYVELVDAGGKKSQDLASFEVCEKTRLVGKRVRVTRQRSNIMALACEGREDCALSESVNLIVRIRELK